MDTYYQYYVSPTWYSNSIPTLALKGEREPDKLVKIGVIHEYLDGLLGEQVLGCRKEITATISPTLTTFQRRFLVKWFLAERKRIISGAFISEGITDPELVSEWLYDMEYGRMFDVTLYDEQVDAEFRLPTFTNRIFWTENVEVTGTSDAPQSFTTDGMLDVWGDPYPDDFDDATEKADVVMVASDSSQLVSIVSTNPAIVGGHITWQGFAADFGSPKPADSNYYANITIIVQTTVP